MSKFTDELAKRVADGAEVPAAESRFATEMRGRGMEVPGTAATRSVGQMLLEGIENTSRGLAQRTRPETEGRKALGEIVSEDDGGGFYYLGADGKQSFADPASTVILRDGNTGKLTAYAQEKQFDESGLRALPRTLAQGIATNPVTGPARVMQPMAKSQLAAERAATALEDAKAFEAGGVRPFGPAFSSGPIAATAKQLSEAPFIGTPVRNALEDSIRGAKDFGADVASRFGAAQSPEDAGRVVQRALSEGLQDTQGQLGAVVDQMRGGRIANADDVGRSVQQGLERHQGDGLTKLDPRTVESIGINPFAPVQRPMNMGAAQASRAAEVEPIRAQLGGGLTTTTRGVPVPMARGREQTYLARRDVSELDPAELNALVRAPSNQTSFQARIEGLYERAYRMIPSQFRIDGSRNPQMLPAHNLRQALQSIGNNVVDSISGQSKLGGELAARIQNVNAGNFSLDDLRAIKTEIGRAIGDSSVLEKTTLDKSQLKQLYAAAARDVENGVMDLANRAYLHSRDANNTSRTSAESARQADGALRALKLADRYMRAGVARMERFQKVLQVDTPETAANRLISAAQGRGRGDIDMLRTGLAVLRPEERADVAALVLEKMGLPKVSARGMTHEAGFAPDEFLKNWNSIDPRARELLFRGQHMQEISDVLGKAERWMKIKSLFNVEDPADLYKQVSAAAFERGSGANEKIKTLGKILSESEKGDIASSIILKLGEPVNSAKGLSQEINYSVGSVGTRWNALSDTAKDVFFTGPHRKALDDYTRVANRLGSVEALANTSRSFTNTMGVGSLAAGATATATGQIAPLLAVLAATGAAAILFSRPAYVTWATKYAQLKAAALQAPPAVALPALAAHVDRLAIMARQDPKLIPLVKAAREEGVVKGTDDEKSRDDQRRK